MYTCNSSSGQKWSNLKIHLSTFIRCDPAEHQQILSFIEAGKLYFLEKIASKLCRNRLIFCKGWATFTFTLTSHNFWLGKGKGKKKWKSWRNLWASSCDATTAKPFSTVALAICYRAMTTSRWLFQLNIVTRVHLKKRKKKSWRRQHFKSLPLISRRKWRLFP